jgi:hypothetical protein
MAGDGRPPEGDWLLTRVQEGLQAWQRFHYGDADTPRDPRKARDAAFDLVSLIMEEPRLADLQGDARRWAINVENGADLLADAELFAGEYDGSDAVDYLTAMGSMYMDRREARHVLRFRVFAWSVFGFCVGAGISALITSLFLCT